MIRAFANYKKDSWDEHLVDLEVVYNSAVNATTLCSPFFANYGIHPRTVPIENMASRDPSEESFFDEMRETGEQRILAWCKKFRQGLKMLWFPVECMNQGS